MTCSGLNVSSVSSPWNDEIENMNPHFENKNATQFPQLSTIVAMFFSRTILIAFDSLFCRKPFEWQSSSNKALFNSD